MLTAIISEYPDAAHLLQVSRQPASPAPDKFSFSITELVFLHILYDNIQVLNRQYAERIFVL